MRAGEMSQTQWQLAEELAKELGRRRVSHNLLREALAYFNRYPEAEKLLDWLGRLCTLGSTFASGRVDVTTTERENLRGALEGSLKKYPQQDWGLILAWAARLMIYYIPQKQPQYNNSRKYR